MGVHYTGEMGVKLAPFLESKRRLIPKRNKGLVCVLFACLMAVPLAWGPQPSKNPSPFKLSVTDIEVGKKFQAYVGGGTNIEPPAAFGGGGGIPSISMSGGATFLAGEISSKSDKVKLVRIEFTVENSGPAPASFKIGDVGLTVGSEKLNDFLAVGYGSSLCLAPDKDRKRLRGIAVAVPPAGGMTRLSIVFPLTNANARRGALVLGDSSPVPFTIEGASES